RARELLDRLERSLSRASPVLGRDVELIKEESFAPELVRPPGDEDRVAHGRGTLEDHDLAAARRAFELLEGALYERLAVSSVLEVARPAYELLEVTPRHAPESHQSCVAGATVKAILSQAPRCGATFRAWSLTS